MKLTAIFLLAACLQVSASGYAQKVTLSLKNAPLQEVFKEINKQTGYQFFYKDDLLHSAGKINLHVNNVSIEEALNRCLVAAPITFKIVDRTIILNSKPVAIEKIIKETNIIVRGKVVDENGRPIQSVSVVIPGTPLGAMTNENGEYSISNAPENAKLLFSYVGYESQTVSINKRENISITLRFEIKKLDETVVIAYGTTTKRKSTGSVSSITAAEIEKQPVSNVLAALPGRLPGVLVAQNNGIPGSTVQIQIRGQNSLSQGGIPLYVIDGVPFTNFNGGQPANDNLNAFGLSGASGGVSPFGLINPNDIERIDILKDADATSIYGARAANGVVLITTKKGKSGKTKLDISINSGTSKVNHFIPVLNLQQYLQMRREAFANDGVIPNTSNAPDLLVWDTTKSTDWQRKFIGGTGHVIDAQATLSGGNETTRFLFNTGYRRESSIFPTSDADKRFSTRLNVEHNSVDRKFYASFTANYSNDNTNLNSSDLASVYNLPPNLPLTDPVTGKLYFANGFTNPLTVLLQKYYGVSTNLIGNAVLSYNILNNLKVKANFGYTASDLSNRTTNPASSNNPSNNPSSSAEFSYNKASNYIVEPTIEYNIKISEGKLTALAGGSLQQNTSNSKYFHGSNYSSEALLGSLSAAGTVAVYYDNVVQYKYAAGFGRLNYDWKGKYIVNANFRRDGSSRFGPNNQFGNFGSIGGAWVFSEEQFFKDNFKFLSFGKLRGSYGTTGNDQISNYTYLALYNPTTAYLGNAAIVPGQIANRNIKWETTNKLEFGIELGLLKDRIYLTADYYHNRSGNQITYTSFPTQSGYNSLSTNLPALIQNSGVELDLSTTNIKTKDFKWTSGFNITIPQNKLISFPGLASTFSASNYIVGQPINFTRLYHYLGVDPATGKATYEDINKDGSITSADRYIGKIGTPYYGGFSNTFSYKNFQLDVFFQFNHVFGRNNIITTRPGALTNQNTSFLNIWQTPGDVSLYPGASATSGSPIANSYNQFSSSDAIYGNASYIKLRSASLSYTIPSQWMNRLKMTNCRVYVEGQNLFTWAKNDYIYDTETQVQGGPSGLGTGTLGQLTPPLRTIVFGINCSF
ncbi:MAG: SusC/RagA family TonB-linked outer membrane protein [Ferruginibacter sp.]